MPRFSPAYRAYMQSPAWQALRLRVKARDGYRCVQCGSRQRLEVDHLHYRTLTRENLSDLQTLCHRCHVKKTRKTRRRRFWRKHGRIIVRLLLLGALFLCLAVL
jgi:5-methylcytosine-specific restriction endonuclease McrA